MDNYRSVLETLKFACPRDILLAATITNTSWHKASSSDELWTLIVEVAEEQVYRGKEESSFALFRRLREITELVSVANDSVRFFDCNSLMWRERVHLSSKLHMNWRGAWIRLPDGQIFCCGGGLQPKCKVHLISGQSVERLQNMNEPRNMHALTLLKGLIYVFGGSNGSKLLQSCEKLDLDPRASVASAPWISLPDMKVARCGFNACKSNGLIYLCGGYSDTCEVFNPDTSSFSLLNYQLPVKNSQTCTVIRNNELVMLMKEWLCRTDVNCTSAKSVFYSESGMLFFSSGQPIILRSCIYRLESETTIYCFNIESLRGHFMKCGW